MKSRNGVNVSRETFPSRKDGNFPTDDDKPKRKDKVIIMKSYEISKKEFEKKFPKVNTYGLTQYFPVYLDCGLVCIDTEWNGERYETNGKIVIPVYESPYNEEQNEIAYYNVY